MLTKILIGLLALVTLTVAVLAFIVHGWADKVDDDELGA